MPAEADDTDMATQKHDVGGEQEVATPDDGPMTAKVKHSNDVSSSHSNEGSIILSGKKIYFPMEIWPNHIDNQVFANSTVENAITIDQITLHLVPNMSATKDGDVIRVHHKNSSRMSIKEQESIDAISSLELKATNPDQDPAEAYDPAAEGGPMVDEPLLQEENKSRILNLTIYYPMSIPPPSSEDRNVRFANALDSISVNKAFLYPPANHDVVHDGNEVHIYPAGSKNLDKFPLHWRTETRKHNRVLRRDKSSHADSAMNVSDSASQSNSLHRSTTTTQISEKPHIPQNSRENDAVVVIIQEDHAEISGCFKLFFPSSLERVAGKDFIRFGDGEGPRELLVFSPGDVTLFLPRGWRMCYHVDGKVIVRDEEYDAKMKEFFKAMEVKLAGKGKITNARNALKNASTILVDLYPSASLEVGGIKFAFPTDAKPIVHRNEVRFPGGLIRTITLAQQDGLQSATLYLGEDWDALRNKQGGVNVYRKSHPSVKEEAALPKIPETVVQHPVHCELCPSVRTPYEEHNIIVKGNYWFWFPEHLKPNVILDEKPEIHFPGSKKHCFVAGIKVHYPSHCDVVLGHEVHVYPKESKVIDNYRDENAQKTFNPKSPRLLGNTVTVGDSSIISLVIDPRLRDVSLKEEADWRASQDPAETAKYEAAVERYILTSKLFNSKEWTRMVRASVGKARNAIQKQGRSETVQRQTARNQLVDTWTEILGEEICNYEESVEISDDMKKIIEDDAKYTEREDEKAQRAIDMINVMRSRDREREQRQQEYDKYFADLSATPKTGGPPDMVRLDRAGKDFMESLIALQLGQPSRLAKDAPSLGISLKCPNLEPQEIAGFL
ncbi:hypothetical protein SCAR479_07872 [Seiridium cardinale]|uniref:Uncharacterized protein n=1 Tax=Seiridium cardinale TaxID=138064 RepID=A0ABR2XNW7_9PEZI